MTKKEKAEIERMIGELDTAVGKLLMMALTNKLIEDAMLQVSRVSFDLDELL